MDNLVRAGKRVRAGDIGCERVTRRGAFRPPSIKEQVLWPVSIEAVLWTVEQVKGCRGRNRVERNMGACLVQVLIQGGRAFGTSLILSIKTYQNPAGLKNVFD